MKRKTKRAAVLAALCLCLAGSTAGVAFAGEAEPFQPVELVTGSNSSFEEKTALPQPTSTGMPTLDSWYYECSPVPVYELTDAKFHGGAKSLKMTMAEGSGNLLYCMRTLDTGVYRFSAFIAADAAKEGAGSLSIVYFNTAFAGPTIVDLTVCNLTADFQEFSAEFSVKVGGDGNKYIQFGTKKSEVRDIDFGQVRMQIWMASGQSVYVDDVKLTKTAEIGEEPPELPEAAINIFASGGFEDDASLPVKDFKLNSWFNEHGLAVARVSEPVSEGKSALKLSPAQAGGNTAGGLYYITTPPGLGFGSYRISVDLAAADKDKLPGAALTVKIFAKNGDNYTEQSVDLAYCGPPSADNAYQTLSGVFDLDFEYTDPATGAYTVTLRSGDTVKTLTSEQGAFIQLRAGVFINGQDTDVFVDRFQMFKTQSRNHTWTQKPSGNLTVNSGFEETLSTGAGINQWFNFPGDGAFATMEAVAGTPENPAYGGEKMLKMSNRKHKNDRPLYTLSASALDVGVRYHLMSQVKTSEKTFVNLVIQLCPSVIGDAVEGGTDEIVISSAVTDGEWTDLSGWFEFYRDFQGYLCVTTSSGDSFSTNIKTMQNIWTDVRTAEVPASNRAELGIGDNYLTADLYLDEYRLLAQDDLPAILPPQEWADKGVTADFQSPMKNDWVPLIGTWATGGGVFAQTESGATGDQWQRQAYYRYAYRDFFVEFYMNFTSESGGWAGFSFARKKAEVGLDNGHAFRVIFQNDPFNAILYEWVPADGTGQTSGEYVYKELLSKSTGVKMPAGDPAHISVLVRDSVVTVWMNNVQIYTYDLKGADTEGYFAFNAGACSVEFRNFKVYGDVTRDAEDEKPVSDYTPNTRTETSRKEGLEPGTVRPADIVDNVGITAIVLVSVGGAALIGVGAAAVIGKKRGKRS